MLVSRHRRGLRIAALGALSATALYLPSARAGAATLARQLSLTPIEEDARWRGHVLDAPTAIVEPPGLDTAAPKCVAGTDQLVVDFERDVGGIVQVDIASAAPLTNLVLGYSETRRFMRPSGDYDPEAYNAGRNDITRTDTIRPSGGRETWRSPAIRGAQRYVVVTVEPALPGGTAGEICLEAIRIEVKHLRATPNDYTGHFLSSDAVLNDVWYAGAHTYHLASVPGCCGQMVVTDGAKRDRQAWAGDLAAAGATGAVSTAAGLQAWKDTLGVFSCYTYPGGYIASAASPTSTCQGRALPLGVPGPDYPVYAAFPVIGAYNALYVSSNYDYWRRSGDSAFLRTQLPVLQGAVQWMQTHLRDGLYHPTPNEWRWTAGFADGADTFTNVVWVAALRQLAEMERTVSADAAAAAAHEALADAMSTDVRRQLWDASAGAFRASTTRSVISQDGNVAAVLAGVIEGDEAISALRYLEDNLRTQHGTRGGDVGYISPFISGLELRARMQTGDVDGALAQLRMTWEPQVHGDPGGTTWERMHATEARPNSGQESAAHPWGSQPTSVLSDYVLGVRPATPGFERWTIAPRPSGLEWAQGDIPTPHGAITSRWQHDVAASTFRLTVAAPAGTSGTVVVPTLGADHQIWRDGQLVWNGGRPGPGTVARTVFGGVAFDDVTGTHTYAWSA